jgi:hypothetical protein
MKIMCPIDIRVMQALELKPNDVELTLLRDEMKIEGEWGEENKRRVLEKLLNTLQEEKKV